MWVTKRYYDIILVIPNYDTTIYYDTRISVDTAYDRLSGKIEMTNIFSCHNTLLKSLIVVRVL